MTITTLIQFWVVALCHPITESLQDRIFIYIPVRTSNLTVITMLCWCVFRLTKIYKCHVP